MKCRFCSSSEMLLFVDLGHTAISNAFVVKEQLFQPEIIYPLNVFVCKECFLVQIDEYQKRECIFSHEYVYFSSISKTWLKHAEKYVEKVTELFHIGKDSFVVEIASNDGYLLQNFVKKKIPCLGIEPTQSTAEKAIEKGVNTIVEFFDTRLAERLNAEMKQADLIIGNNVLAHVPNLNDFVNGMKILLKPYGAITMEFPHFLKLIEKVEFDTIYHEHYSYFSFSSIKRIFKRSGLDIFDVEELPTHGGSLRIYAKHEDDDTKIISSSAYNLLEREKIEGIDIIETYQGFQDKVIRIKNNFLQYIISEKLQNKRIVGFGAAAKGNTFLNFCGIKSDVIEYVVDETPVKQGKFLPQSHIPVVPLEQLREDNPDIIVILPWNFEKEIIEKLSFAREWGAKFVTYIPELKVV